MAYIIYHYRTTTHTHTRPTLFWCMLHTTSMRTINTNSSTFFMLHASVQSNKHGSKLSQPGSLLLGPHYHLWPYKIISHRRWLLIWGTLTKNVNAAPLAPLCLFSTNITTPLAAVLKLTKCLSYSSKPQAKSFWTSLAASPFDPKGACSTSSSCMITIATLSLLKPFRTEKVGKLLEPTSN